MDSIKIKTPKLKLKTTFSRGKLRNTIKKRKQLERSLEEKVDSKVKKMRKVQNIQQTQKERGNL